jgi:hypothetical protein
MLTTASTSNDSLGARLHRHSDRTIPHHLVSQGVSSRDGRAPRRGAFRHELPLAVFDTWSKRVLVVIQ